MNWNILRLVNKLASQQQYIDRIILMFSAEKLNNIVAYVRVKIARGLHFITENPIGLQQKANFKLKKILCSNIPI